MPGRRLPAATWLAGVHGVVRPVLDADDREVRAVADHDLDVPGEAGRARVVEHQDRVGVRARFDDHVRVGAERRPATRDVDVQGLGRLEPGRHPQVERLRRPGRRDGRGPVAGLEHGAARGLAGRERADGHLGGNADAVRHSPVVGRDVVEQGADAVERREPPDLLAARGHDAAEVDAMHAAWVKSCLLQVTLWSHPYVKDGDF